MDSSDGGPTPNVDTSGQLATMANVQLAMAHAQRAMAEALLALSKGIAQPGPHSADLPGDVSAFMHSGFLDPTSATPETLRFLDSVGTSELLVSLADRGKRIQLEFELSPESEYAGRTDEEKAVFFALGSFLATRAAALIPMKSTCENKPKPPAQRPPPAPRPTPPAPPPDKS